MLNNEKVIKDDIMYLKPHFDAEACRVTVILKNGYWANRELLDNIKCGGIYGPLL